MSMMVDGRRSISPGEGGQLLNKASKVVAMHIYVSVRDASLISPCVVRISLSVFVQSCKIAFLHFPFL